MTYCRALDGLILLIRLNTRLEWTKLFLIFFESKGKTINKEKRK